ncbi:MAG: four helix bundle protein [Pyrinomonadaceae bacterium]|nr:four helix bundle protein [Phycisphaerales bacterium]
MSEIRTFRDLFAWQRGMALARQVYKVTKLMPPDERFGLTMQMRRAVVSIPSNIAEGHARQSTADYLRFLRIARGSLAEVATQLELTFSMNMLAEDLPTLDILAETDRVLQGLIRSLEPKK